MASLSTAPATALQTELAAVTTGCRSCGSEASLVVTRRLAGGILVTRCPACSVAALRPCPSDAAIREHYSRYYLTRTAADGRMDRLVEMHRPIVQYLAGIAAGAPPFSFLDYGFGSGTFLRQVAASGHRAFGADISPQNVAQLVETSLREGSSIEVVDLSSTGLGDLGQAHFDVVTLFQVIEHVPEPLALLRGLSRYQQNADVVYIECPNDTSVLSRAKTFNQRLSRRGNKWRSMKYPEHLHGFNKKALSTLLRAAGYDVVACGDYGHCDGTHQVEGVCWWPPFRENPAWYKPYGFSRSLIQLADSAMSRAFGSGSGLYAIGRFVRAG